MGPLKCEFEMFEKVGGGDRSSVCCVSSAGGLGVGEYKDVALDIKAGEQTCEACTHTHTDTHREKPRHTLFDIISGARHVIYMQNPQSPPIPLVNMSCSGGGR